MVKAMEIRFGAGAATAQADAALVGPGAAVAAALAAGTDGADLSELRAQLAVLGAEGAEWVEIHEPLLGTGLSKPLAAALKDAYAALAEAGPKIMLSGPAGAPGADLWPALSLPVAGLHLDLVAGPQQLRDALDAGVDMVFALGLVEGEDRGRDDLAAAARWARVAMRRHGAARIWLSNAGPLPPEGAALDDRRASLSRAARAVLEGEGALLPAEAAETPESAPARAAGG